MKDTKIKKIRLCQVKGCERKYKARGYCSMHYYQAITLDKWVQHKVNEPQFKKICKVEGCNRKYRVKGYCGLHYSRLQTGKPLIQPKDSKTIVNKCTTAIQKSFALNYEHKGYASGEIDEMKRVKATTLVEPKINLFRKFLRMIGWK